MEARAQHLNEWLLSRNWTALAGYFARHEPSGADEFTARALLNIHRGDVRVDWAAAVADLRKACSLKPGDLQLSSNLVQALLDSGQPHEAHDLARRIHLLHRDSYPALEKLALAASAAHKWGESLDALLTAQKRLGESTLPEPAASLLKDLSTRWWLPLAMGDTRLRRPDSSDRDFLAATFRNAGFMQHYHRFQGRSDEALNSFIAKAQASPRQTRRIDWIILDSSGKRIGLAAIVDIDWSNQRGEFLVGLPAANAQPLALKASVAVLDFAFTTLGLAKMVAYVYGDNPVAQSNAVHLGFTQEGLLREHLAEGAGRLDLIINGMTRADFRNNALLAKLINRWSTRGG